jgi:hypothetical protein
MFRPYPAVLDSDLQLAARLGGQIEALGTAPLVADIGGSSEPWASIAMRAQFQTSSISFISTPAASMD